MFYFRMLRPMRDRTAVAGLVKGLVCALVLIAAFARPNSIMAAEDFSDCRIEVLDGRVRLKNEDGTRVAKVGDTVANADTVVTGPSGRLRIKCGDRASFTIGAYSQIVFEKLTRASSNEKLVVRVARGIAGFIVYLLGSDRFEVHTPSAVATVRSTEWTIDARRKGTAVFVRKGVVDVSGSRGASPRAQLQAGDGVDVGLDGAVGTVKTWGQKRIDRMNARLGYDWE